MAKFAWLGPPKWQLDDNYGFITFGNRVSYIKEELSTPRNAMYLESDHSIEGVRLWTVTIGKGVGLRDISEISIGVTDRDHFGFGYSTKGLFYNGNLHGGSSRIKGNFGPQLKPGNVVRMRLVEREDKVKLYFSIDNAAFKLAFSVPSSKFKTRIFPVIQFYKSATVKVEPSVDTPDIGIEDTPSVPPVGNWVLDVQSTEVDELKGPDSPTLQLSERPYGYDVFLKAGNSIRFAWKKNKEGKWNATFGPATLMTGNMIAPGFLYIASISYSGGRLVAKFL